MLWSKKFSNHKRKLWKLCANNQIEENRLHLNKSCRLATALLNRKKVWHYCNQTCQETSSNSKCFQPRNSKLMQNQLMVSIRSDSFSNYRDTQSTLIILLLCFFLIFNLQQRRSALNGQQNKKLLHEYFLLWPLLTTEIICHIVTFDLQAVAQVCKRCWNRQESSGSWCKVCIDLQDYWDGMNITGMYTTLCFQQTGVGRHKSLIMLRTALQ